MKEETKKKGQSCNCLQKWNMQIIMISCPLTCNWPFTLDIHITRIYLVATTTRVPFNMYTYTHTCICMCTWRRTGALVECTHAGLMMSIGILLIFDWGGRQRKNIACVWGPEYFFLLQWWQRRPRKKMRFFITQSLGLYLLYMYTLACVFVQKHVHKCTLNCNRQK